MRIKKGVRLDGIRPEIVAIFPVVAKVFQESGAQCVLTSGREGKHSTRSLHPKGLAVDFRRNEGSFSAQTMVDMLTDRLPDEYDVVLEDDHIHIEYDLKEL